MCSAQKPSVILNGAQIGKAIEGTIFYEDLKPGNYQILTTQSYGMHLDLELPAGKTIYVEFDVNPWKAYCVYYPEVVPPSVAVDKIRNLHFTGRGKYRELH